MGITNLVHCTQEIIPSFVWLKRHYQVKNFLGNIPGSTLFRVSSSGNRAGTVVSEGEMCVTSGLACCHSGRISSLVESHPQIIKSIKGDKSQDIRDWFSQLKLLDFECSISVRFTDKLMWSSFEPFGKFDIQFPVAA